MSSKGASRKRQMEPPSVESPPPEEEPTTNEAAPQSSTGLKLYSAKAISQLFMQFFFKNQCVSESRLNLLITAYNLCYIERVNQKKVHLNLLLSQSNRILRPIGIQIKKSYDPVTKVYYYVLFNEMADLHSRHNKWSAKESTFFFLVLDEIVKAFLSNADEATVNPKKLDYTFMSVSTNALINLSRRIPHLSMTVGEKLLKKWKLAHWVEFLDHRKRVTIGIWSMSAMSSYMNRKFSIYTCYTCNLSCFIGKACPKCNLCLHYHCLEEKAQSGHPCPTCNLPLSEVKALVPPPKNPEQPEPVAEPEQQHPQEENNDEDMEE